MGKFWKNTVFLLVLGLVPVKNFGQNAFINNWSIHNSNDTNIYLGFGTVDRLSVSSVNYGKWVVPDYKRSSNVLAQSSQNRELLRFGISMPHREITYVNSLQSFQQKRFSSEEFNGLIHGIYNQDSIRLGMLSSLYSSLIEHRIEFTRKLESTTAQLRISASHINTFREEMASGFLHKNETTFQGSYETRSISYNGQLDYLGNLNDALRRDLTWRDSVRVTFFREIPVIPSLGVYLIHRPTEFTEFSLLIDGIAPQSSIKLNYREDSTNFELNTNLYSTRDLISEETTLVLNGDYFYNETPISNKDSVLPLRVVPLRIEAGYKVKVEPLLHLGFYASYFEYQNITYGRATFMMERTYNNENALQLGLTSYYMSNSLKPNISLGMRVRLAEKVMLYSFTDALLSAPWIDSDILPGWTNRFSINATIQCQLL